QFSETITAAVVWVTKRLHSPLRSALCATACATLLVISTSSTRSFVRTRTSTITQPFYGRARRAASRGCIVSSRARVSIVPPIRYRSANRAGGSACDVLPAHRRNRIAGHGQHGTGTAGILVRVRQHLLIPGRLADRAGRGGRGRADAMASVSARPDLRVAGMGRFAVQHLSHQGPLHVARRGAAVREIRNSVPPPEQIPAQRPACSARGLHG